MRILIVSQYFWPESFIINDLARALVADGHDIIVVTGKPNYPTGRIWPGYRQTGVEHDRFAEDIEIIRVPLRPRGDAAAIDLALNYLSFVFSGMLYFPRLLRKRDFDVVLFFGVSPMTAAIPAALVAWQKKAHLALWVQDLWPESLSATGFVTNRLALWLVRFMMRSIYRCADTLLLQSEAFVAPVSRNAESGKIVYFPNPAPIQDDMPLVLPAQLEEKFGDYFSVVFAGNLGRAQSLETIVEAATHLRPHSRIRLIIAGTGSEADNLRQMIANKGVQNIVMIGLIERAMMPSLFRRADALLVTLKDEATLDMVVPSKVQAYLQAGKPIIGALNGEGARIISETRSGLVVPAKDGVGLAKSILTLSSMPDSTLKTMGLAGRHYFESHFQISHVARKLIDVLETRMGNRKVDKK